MAIKIIVDIQGNLYDLWEVRSLEKGERYNDTEGQERMEYLIIMNRLAIATNANQVVFAYDDEEERNQILRGLKVKLTEYDNVIILG